MNATKAQALATARRFGFELDEANSGVQGGCFTVIFDHPTHSIGADCRSITCVNHRGFSDTASSTWGEAIERMESEGPFLTPCNDPDCDYHNEDKTETSFDWAVRNGAPRG